MNVVIGVISVKYLNFTQDGGGRRGGWVAGWGGGVGGQDGYFSAHCVVNSDKLATVIAEF